MTEPKRVADKLSETCSARKATCSLRDRGARIELVHVLNDRHVARLYKTLTELTRSHSAKVVEQEFERAFAAYRDQWSRPGILPTQNKLTAILFLSSQFCSVERLDRKYQDWLEWYLDRLPEDPNYGHRSDGKTVKTIHDHCCFERKGGPDGLAMVNLYMMVYQRAQTAGGFQPELNHVSRNLGEISGIGELPLLKNHPLIFTTYVFPVYPDYGNATVLLGPGDWGVDNRRARICAFACARGLVASESVMRQWLKSVKVCVPFESDQLQRTSSASSANTVGLRPSLVLPR